MKYTFASQGHTFCHRPLRAERRISISCHSQTRQPNVNVRSSVDVSRRLFLTAISIIPSLSLWASASAEEQELVGTESPPIKQVDCMSPINFRRHFTSCRFILLFISTCNAYV